MSVCEMACRPLGFNRVKRVISYREENLLSGRNSRRDVCRSRGQNQKVLFAKWAQQIVLDCPFISGCPLLVSNGTNYLGDPWFISFLAKSNTTKYNQTYLSLLELVRAFASDS